MQKNRTKLKTDQDLNKKEPGSINQSASKPLKGVEKKADSLITHSLKIATALLPAFFLAGVISGILGTSTGLDIEFGSMEFYLISIPQTALFFYLFLKTFDYFGLFEHPGNPGQDSSKKG